MLPKTSWKYGRETEIDRIVNTLHYSANYFFSKYRFLVVPRLVMGNGQTVYLPDWGYGWRLLKDCSRLIAKVPMTDKLGIIGPIGKMLDASGWQENIFRMKEVKKVWQKKEKLFWEYFVDFFPEIKIDEVEIQPTSFGALSSFDKQDKKLIVIMRMDMDISHLAEAILSGALMDRLDGFSWQERESLVDGLMLESKFGKLFPNYRGTLELLDDKDNVKLVEESRLYLEKLGIGTKEIFSIKEGVLWINNQPCLGKFTMPELEVMKELVRQKNQLCSLDGLAEVVWREQSETKFSAWAITKIIERIRKKIADLGISPAVIQVKRKEGYVLVD